jgi:hypothetical protein
MSSSSIASNIYANVVTERLTKANHVTWKAQVMAVLRGARLIGHVKDRRGDQRGGEWEPIKIPQRNLAYIPEPTRDPFLLTRPRLISYGQAISLRKRTRIYTGNQNWCSVITCGIDNTNRSRRQFISSRAFHRTLGGRVRETTTGEQF